MLQTVIRQRARVSQQLPGELVSGGKVIPPEAVRHQPAQRDGSHVRAGPQLFEPRPRRCRSQRIGALKPQDGQIQLIQLIGWFEAAGRFKLPGGIGPGYPLPKPLECVSRGLFPALPCLDCLFPFGG